LPPSTNVCLGNTLLRKVKRWLLNSRMMSKMNKQAEGKSKKGNIQTTCFWLPANIKATKRSMHTEGQYV
jgi:hypothetical protein